MKRDTDLPGFNPSHLQGNLSALALRSPQLCQWLQDLPEEGAFQVKLAASGHPNVLLDEQDGVFLHSSTDPVAEAEEAAGKLGGDHHQAILCLGVGLGYYLAALLKRSNPCQPIFAYERNPWLLHLTLMRSDFRRDILAGRLRFLSPPDLLRHSPQGQQQFLVWPHPVLGPIYDWERRFFASTAIATGSYRRALVLAGSLFALDVAEALQDKGLEVSNWYATAPNQRDITEEIVASDPQLIVSINYRHGLPEISSKLGIPLLIWEIDPTIEHPASQQTNHPLTYIYTYRKANVAKFRKAGFAHVEYLPLAANPKRRHPMALSPHEIERYDADVSFAGSSMTGQAEVLCRLYDRLTQGKDFPQQPDSPIRDYSRLRELALAEQAKQPDDYAIEAVFKKHLAQEQRLAADNEGRLVDLAVCIAESAASQRRTLALSALSHLGREMRVAVWGDEGWLQALPEGIHCRGLVGHFVELTAVYNASRINLDINRIYQRDIVTMRVFDVLACRAFVLADFSDDLGELFSVDEEVIAYRSLAQLPSLAGHFLTHPGEREQIAAAGYQRVLKEHTITLRVERMLNNLP